MTIYAADPINQFHRLIEVTPGVTYALGSPWNNTRIVNGRVHDFDSENCMASIGAVARDFETGGRDKSSPNEIRNHQGDFLGGIGVDDVQDAWGALGWGPLWTPPNTGWGDAMGFAREGRFVGIGVDYESVPWAFQEQKNGTFDHALGFSHPKTDGSILRYDSLGRAPRRVPQYAIRTAAEQLAQRVRHDKGQLFVFVTQPGKVVVSLVVYRFGGEPRFRGAYLARHDNLPVRSAPRDAATKVGELDHRGSFAARQTVVRNGEPFWFGNAKGDKWVYAERMWYQGGITGKEDIE